jgi:hypothetical protein
MSRTYRRKTSSLVLPTSPIWTFAVFSCTTLGRWGCRRKRFADVRHELLGHIAWGGGIPSFLADWRCRSGTELEAFGVIPSGVHVDFMIGNSGLRGEGVTADGRCVPILLEEVGAARSRGSLRALGRRREGFGPVRRRSEICHSIDARAPGRRALSDQQRCQEESCQRPHRHVPGVSEEEHEFAGW